MKLLNIFWGMLAILIATVFVYAFYTPMLMLAGLQPTSEMKMFGFIGIAIMLTFLVFVSPISNFIADDQGNV